MDNSTANFTTAETSTNLTTHFVQLTHILTMCVYSISVLLGLSTHSYVLWLIVTGTKGVASEFLNLNVSVCEIGISLNCLLFVISGFFSSPTKLPMFLLGLVYTGRPLFQCLICVERYLAVVHPVIFLKSKPLRYRVICCVGVWIITLNACFFCFYMSEIHKQFFLLQYVLFLCIQLFCLVAVLRALKQSGPGDRRREEENHMKRRAFHIILITTVSMTIIYVPCTITALVAILTDQNIFMLWITGLICYVLAGFVQPLLYLHSTGKLSCLCASHLQ